MANWVASFLAANPQYAAMPVVKRDRRSIHFRRPDGLIEAQFTGAPMHWLDGAEWRPLDTALRLLASGNYGADGIPIEIAPDRTARIGSYGQRTRRVGLFDLDTRAFAPIFTVPIGNVEGDCMVASGARWEHRLRLMEDGLQETLTLTQRLDLAAGPNDWLVLETQLWGVDFPDGWVGEFSTAGMRFGLPTCTDAAGDMPQCRRYARKDGAAQLLYTAVPVSWLATAAYPVVLDPDFAGSTADGRISGVDASYAITRSTSFYVDTAGTTFQVGQQYPENYFVHRGFLKFDTSAIGAGSTVTQVNLKLVCITDQSDTDFDVQIVKQDWGVQDPLSDANREAAYDNCLAGTADDNIWLNTVNVVVNNQQASGNLAVAWVNKIGNTYYSLRSSRDLAGTTPTGNERLILAAAENTEPAYRPVLTVLYSAGGATVTVTGGFTPAAAIVRQDSRGIAGGFTPAATTTKQDSRGLTGAFTPSGAGLFARVINVALTAALSFVGAVQRQVGKVATAALTMAGVVARASTRTMAGALTSVGAVVVVRTLAVALTAALTLAGTIVRQDRRLLAGALSLAGVITQRGSKIFDAVLSFVGSVARASQLTLTAVQMFIGLLTQTSSRTLAGTFTPAGEAIKQVGLGLAGALIFVGTVAAIRQLLVALTAGLTFIGSLTQQVRLAVGGALSLAGAIAMAGGIAFIAAVGFAGVVGHRVDMALGGALTIAGSIAQRIALAFVAALSLAGAIVKRGQTLLAGSIAPGGTVARTLGMALGGTLASAGAIAKASGLGLSSTLTFVGALGKAASVALAATLSPTAAIIRQGRLGEAASLTAAGAIIRGANRMVAGVIAPVGIVAKTLSLHLGDVLSLVGNFTRPLALAASLALAGAITKSGRITEAAVLTMAGAIGRVGALSLMATLNLAGAIGRALSRAVSGALSFVGSIAQWFLGVRPATATVSDAATATLALDDAAVATIIAADIYLATLVAADALTATATVADVGVATLTISDVAV